MAGRGKSAAPHSAPGAGAQRAGRYRYPLFRAFSGEWVLWELALSQFKKSCWHGDARLFAQPSGD